MPLTGVPVLIVEDDPASAKLLAVVARGAGCEVRTAASAEDALAIVAGFRPRVVLVDLVLPLMSGLLLAETLRAAPASRDAVIVGMSAIDGDVIAQSALAAGCDDFVAKPLDVLTIADLLARHLGSLS